jgi:vanillate O-demethylase ferredoxin subunit
MAINALAIYAIFTPLHDATHGSLSSHRGLNDVLSTIAAFPLVPGFTTQLYRYLHMEHHRHTGVPVADPDEVTVGTRMPMRFLAWNFLDLYWFSGYLRRIPQRPAKEVAGGVDKSQRLRWLARGVACITFCA